MSLAGRTGGTTGSADLGGDTGDLLGDLEDGLLKLRLLTNLGIRLSVRLLPEELEGREYDCGDNCCWRCWRCDVVDGSLISLGSSLILGIV